MTNEHEDRKRAKKKNKNGNNGKKKVVTFFFCCILENGWGNPAETSCFGKVTAGVMRKKSNDGYPARIHSETNHIISYQIWLRDLVHYSQTWELRPPKGLGVSGPIFQVVSFARFGSKIFNMELYTCPCASHDISDRWLPRVSGGVTSGACKRDDRSFGVPTN